MIFHALVDTENHVKVHGQADSPKHTAFFYQEKKIPPAEKNTTEPAGKTEPAAKTEPADAAHLSVAMCK